MVVLAIKGGQKKAPIFAPHDFSVEGVGWAVKDYQHDFDVFSRVPYDKEPRNLIQVMIKALTLGS